LEATRAFYEDELGLSHSWDFELEGTRNYYVTGELFHVDGGCSAI
jgi:hypothetical protein